MKKKGWYIKVYVNNYIYKTKKKQIFKIMQVLLVVSIKMFSMTEYIKAKFNHYIKAKIILLCLSCPMSTVILQVGGHKNR